MTNQNEFAQILQSAIENAYTKIGHSTIIVAGKTGVGKSTLINAVFREDLADTGSGRPITSDAREISKRDFPISIIDTRGLETGDSAQESIKQLRDEIRRRNSDRDENKHVHVAWLCVLEASRRVEPSESQLVKMFAENNIPTIAVITKAIADEGFRYKVQELLPEVRQVVRVVAKEIVLEEDEHIIRPKGLDTLIRATLEVVPEGQTNAIISANRVAIQAKFDQARKIIALAAATAAGIGAAPIPFSDAVGIIPTQVGMLALISAVWGLNINNVFLGTLLSGAAMSSIGTLGGREIAANLIKLIPGVGAVVGGFISASTAAFITGLIGEAYLGALYHLTKENPDREIDVVELRETFINNLKGSTPPAE